MIRPDRFRPAILLSVGAVCLAARMMGTTYYVSPNGNDNGSGTSQAQAWRTIDRVNQMTYGFQPGDQVLFQKGGIYRGNLQMGSSGTSNSPIVIGAYGAGEEPIISGSDLVTGWTNYQGNIWQASVSVTAVGHVFINGEPMTLARYPNTGWLRNDNGSNTTITDAALTQPSGYWTGATLVVRSSNWSYDAPVITGYANHTLTFPNIYYGLNDLEWGYFLCNKLSELDAPGEWFFDQNAGLLYLWAPNNANPNNLSVEASVREQGVTLQWSRHHINVTGLHFQHQTNSGVRNDGADHAAVTGCTFTDLYHGIRSYGSYNTYNDNVFQRTYATGAYLIDDHTTFQGNTLNEVAMQPGLGESSWGYFGVRMIGTGNVVRLNRFEEIGYTAIEVDNNTLVEKNYLFHALALLNDGGGIAFDNANGMVVQDNIVVDLVGNLESSAPDFDNYLPICHGIYFGNTSIQNTIVQRNTVVNSPGSGIHMDHTMLSTGNQVKDNVLYNNEVQLSISDFSNNNGPGAVYPYHLDQFNDVISGNVLYCLREEQLCMKQFNCYSAVPVDFGTFSNNHYFNPYNEMSIFIHNTYSGDQRYYALERWQAERNEDAGSDGSPLHLQRFAVTNYLSNNPVNNPQFDYDVTGWSFWPTNAQLVHDYTYLDNGAMKALLPNANQYPELTVHNNTTTGIQSGQWYALSFSVQSSMLGEIRAGVKGVTQQTGPQMVVSKRIPFSTTRRDVTIVFQSDLTDQADCRFTNNYNESTYWLDNVSLRRVEVAEQDPGERFIVLCNDQNSTQSFPLTGCWSDVDGDLHNGDVQLAPFSSIVLAKEDDSACGLTTGIGDSAEGTMPTDVLRIHPNPVLSGGRLVLTHDLGAGVAMDLVDAQGRIVMSEPLVPASSELRLPSDLVPGAYSVVLRSESGRRTGRLMVQR